MSKKTITLADAGAQTEARAIARLEFTCPDCDPYVVETNLGRYVRYADHATALAAKNAELAAVKAERDEHKRLKNALVLKAYPAMDGADDLVEALERYGFPVSDAAEPALMEGGSREAKALHKAAKAFIAARRALTGGGDD